MNSYSEVSMKKFGIFIAQFFVFSFALLANTLNAPVPTPASAGTRKVVEEF